MQRALNDALARMGDLEPQRVPLREAIAHDYRSQGPAALGLSAQKLWDLIGGPPNTILPLNDPRADALVAGFVAERLPTLADFDARIAELSTQPYWEIRDQIPDVPAGLRPGALAMALRPVSPRGILIQARRDLEWQATELMIRLELHRTRTDAYPDTLTQLKGVSATDLIDPLSGKPLVYEKLASTYRLYSVSVDGVDNGGDVGEVYHDRFEDGHDHVLWDGSAQD